MDDVKSLVAIIASVKMPATQMKVILRHLIIKNSVNPMGAVNLIPIHVPSLFDLIL